MWPNPQKTADLLHLLKESLMENFIFCAVKFYTFIYNTFNKVINIWTL